jgi:CRP-like cAMP-binding protein
MDQVNHLLTSLLKARPDQYSRLKTVELRRGQVLAEPLAQLNRVYFPYSGIISFSVPLKDGHLVQAGLVGRDGEVGGLQALDGKVSPNRIVVLVPGRAAVMDADQFSEIVQADPGRRSVFLSHEQFVLAEVQQSVACNAVHTVQQRMCRWILRMNDLIGLKVPLTQDLLATMIAVRRTSVTAAAGMLQKEGSIRYSRGQIHIADIERLKRSSCECYTAVRDHYDRIMNRHHSSTADH